MLALRQSEEKDAFSLVEQGRADEAVAACEAALSQRADDIAALHAWGLAEIRRARYREAAALLERALAIDAADPLLHNNCGEAHRLAGDSERAFECYRQALLIDNSNAVPHLNLGLVMHGRGQLAEAEHFFINAVQRAPGMARPYIELAELYREEGDGFRALQCYRQGTGFAPENVRWLTRFATLLAERGDTLESRAVLRRATALEQPDASAWYERARVEFQLCDEPAAIDAYRRAVRIDARVSRHRAGRVLAVRRVAPSALCERTGGEYVRLARSQWLRLPPPRAIPPEAARLWASGDLIEPLAPELFLAQVRDVELAPEEFIVIAGGREVLIEGLANRAQHYAGAGRHAVCESDDGRLLLDLPANSVGIEMPCAVLGGAGDLFSFFFEGLARLWAIEQRDRVAGLPLVVPASLDADRSALLDALDVPAARRIPLQEDAVARCREVWLPALPAVGEWVSPLAVQFLRRRLLGTLPAGAGAGAGRGRRIWLSRRDCGSRRLANEDELVPLLARHGFEPIAQSGLSLSGLLAIVSEAGAIVALDDAALAATVVAPQGARIGVIATRGIWRPRAYCIAAQLGLELTYLVAEPRFDSHPVHAECDVDLPAAALEEFLSGL